MIKPNIPDTAENPFFSCIDIHDFFKISYFSFSRLGFLLSFFYYHLIFTFLLEILLYNQEIERMSIVDEAIKFITDELNIKITNK